MSQHPIPLLAPERHMREAGPYGAVAQKVLLGGRYILGDEVAAFEAHVAQTLGAPHALGVSSGTDALLLALMTLGVRPGDQIICPTFTFFATAGVIARLQAKPVFVDSCPACMTLDVDQVHRAITPLTRAVLPVHLFGHGANMPQLMEVAQKNQLGVIEDVAQAMGTQVCGQAAGTWGQMGCLSFFPSKNLGGFGDGGMVLLADADLDARARSLRVHGAGQPRYLHHEVGGNFRLDALQAALLDLRLKDLPRHLDARARHARHYTQELLGTGLAHMRRCGCAQGGAKASGTARPPTPLGLPTFAPGDTVNQYVVTFAQAAMRDSVQAFLRQQEISTSVYYPLPLHLQPCFAHLGYGPGAFPVAERLAGQSLALPIAPELTDEEIHRVSAAVSTGMQQYLATA
jgi:dTDP-4-amino-4,6-dideoxygalactose transaminase